MEIVRIIKGDRLWYKNGESNREGILNKHMVPASMVIYPLLNMQVVIIGTGMTNSTGMVTYPPLKYHM